MELNAFLYGLAVSIAVLSKRMRVQPTFTFSSAGKQTLRNESTSLLKMFNMHVGFRSFVPLWYQNQLDNFSILSKF